MFRSLTSSMRQIVVQNSSCALAAGQPSSSVTSHSPCLSLLLARTLSAMPKEDVERLVKSEKVMVFMKGVPEQPMCGFSNAVVQIMRMHGVAFSSVNVLENEEVRQAIKDYSDWPTIPQVYLEGEFVGGCDILLEMHRNGDLVEVLEKAGIKSALLEKTEESENKGKDS